jgi:putative membrane protein
MKTSPFLRVLALILLLIAPSLPAADGAAAPATWHAQSLGQAIGYMLLFAAIGIAAAVLGYKLFDKCTPGNLDKEILENRNVAAAIVAAAVILGVCIIIAASMLG